MVSEKKNTPINVGFLTCVAFFKGNMYRDIPYTEDSLQESMQRCAVVFD